MGVNEDKFVNGGVIYGTGYSFNGSGVAWTRGGWGFFRRDFFARGKIAMEII